MIFADAVPLDLASVLDATGAVRGEERPALHLRCIPEAGQGYGNFLWENTENEGDL